MSVHSQPEPDLLQRVMQADRYRLTQRWKRLARGASDANGLARWQQDAEASAALLEARQRSVPQIACDPELPIAAHREEIVALLKSRQVIVVCGETGSGKSTQLPKFCLEAGLGVRGMIGHTQPRRLAARAIAGRLAEELKTSVGELVGFKIRFTDATRDQTLVKLMTDGVLLAETQSDRFLDKYDALIIDEAHERSLNIDFLLGYLHGVLARRPDLRLIITSATIDPQRFAEHFRDEQGPAPIIEVSGRTYPVDILYQPVEEELGEQRGDDDRLARAIAEAFDDLSATGPGDVLAFLPTERDIRITAKYLRGHLLRQGKDKRVEVLPLYARLSQAEQNKIFAPHNKQRIVLSTNVAESSLTVPGIRFVIDSGLVRISRYAPRSKVRRLPIEDISQASANQRSGRCGRIGPGICIRLYSEDDFQKRPRFTTPEIRRSDLASVLLQSHMLKLGPLEDFPLLDAPSAEALRDGRKTLEELGAIDADNRLTEVGRQLGALPCEPRVGRILIEASQRNCLAEVLVIAAAIECQDVRQRPAGQRDEADAAHQKFQDPHSDFLSYIRLWEFYNKLRSDLGRSRLQRALQKNFLSPQGFREWSETVRQLKDILATARLRPSGWQLHLEPIDPSVFEKQKPDPRQSSQSARNKPKLERPELYGPIHQSLLAGLLSGIAVRGERYEYKAARGLEVSLWPGSGLFHRQPQWIVAGEIVETNRRYARTVAEVDVEWIESAAASLLKHSYSDPHWSKKSSSAMVYRRSTLFGLPVVAGRRTPLAPIDPDAARSLMIEHGLVGGEWQCDLAFYRHNQELLADMHELAQRTRSSEYILDRFHIGNFYQQRIPETVTDLNSLKAWIRKHPQSEAERRLWMQPQDFLSEKSQLDRIEHRFPNELQVGASRFPLQYHFEPGHAEDGVTITVPAAALRQVSEEALGWLVPGLLEEKIMHLIRSLPKSQRTHFVPAPDVARKLAGELAGKPHDQAFLAELCAAMRAYSGEAIRPSDFELERLPAHLRFLIRVVDDAGEVLGTGRDVAELQKQHAGLTLPAAADSAQPVTEWVPREVTPENFEQLEGQVTIQRGGVKVAAFPALVDLGDRVEMRLVDTGLEAETQSAAGFVRLFAIQHRRSLKNHVKHLPKLDQAALKLSHLLQPKELKAAVEDLMVRVALVEDQPLPGNRAQLDERNQTASVQLSIAAQEISGWLPKLADEIHQLRLELERAPASWREVTDALAEQVRELVPEGFLRTTSWHGLREYPRYFKAMRMRLEKLTSGGLPKDQRLREPIDAAWTEYVNLRQQLSANGQDHEQLEKVRWMIEEFRVSQFAQTLGTKQTVSEKRIREAIQRLQP